MPMASASGVAMAAVSAASSSVFGKRSRTSSATRNPLAMDVPGSPVIESPQPGRISDRRRTIEPELRAQCGDGLGRRALAQGLLGSIAGQQRRDRENHRGDEQQRERCRARAACDESGQADSARALMLSPRATRVRRTGNP